MQEIQPIIAFTGEEAVDTGGLLIRIIPITNVTNLYSRRKCISFTNSKIAN